MAYLSLKSLHILSVIVWMGMMLLVPIHIGKVNGLYGDERERWISRIRTLFLGVATPALAATWILGITLLTWGGWMSATWMRTKLPLVIVLSGLHGFFSGQLRRLAGDASYMPSPSWSRRVLFAELLALACVIFLAVIKPN